MSVSTTAEIGYEHWGGYDDPRLPTRVWKMAATVTGDLSGGLRSLTFEFVNSDAPRVSQSFSLEELYILDFDNTTKRVDIRGTNFGVFRGLERTLGLSVSVPATAGSTSSLDVKDAEAIRGTFLGAQNVVGVQTALIFQLANSDTDEVKIWAGGYVWGQRSQSALKGGFQRPLNGIFRG